MLFWLRKISLFFLCLIILLFFIEVSSYAVTYTVTNCSSNVSLVGSLPWAVNVSTNEGDIITFNISTLDGTVGYSSGESYPGLVTNEVNGTSWFRIIISSILDVSSDRVYINGSSQPTTESYNPYGPEIEIRSGGGVANGIRLVNKDYCTIEGICVGGFSGTEYAGINIGRFSDHNEVKNCYIGVTPSGEGKNANYNGVFIHNGFLFGLLEPSQFNTIGGTAEGTRNIISGNSKRGIYIAGSPSNEVLGNYIGIDAAGVLPISNESGVVISLLQAQRNKIGNGAASGRNIISGNSSSLASSYGISIVSSATSNEIIGNYIGLNAGGASALGNGYGIFISSSNSNFVGNPLVSEKNIISGNFYAGIVLGSANSNEVANNYIGTDYTGLVSVPNNTQGIYLNTNSSYNKLGKSVANGGNVISGNTSSGVYLSSGSNNNDILGNYIGINANGTAALANGYNGVYFQTTTSDAVVYGNHIGDKTAQGRNIISGNAFHGIFFVSSTSNEIMGNYIGTDATGTTAIGNDRSGIQLGYTFAAGSVTPSYNHIGDGTSAGRNIISGNNTSQSTVAAGLYLGTSNSNEVLGNYIGVDVTGNVALPNYAQGVFMVAPSADAVSFTRYNVIGNGTALGRNVISGNAGHGIRMWKSFYNTISGNYIGLAADGVTSLGNQSHGVFVETKSLDNTFSNNVMANNGTSGSYSGIACNSLTVTAETITRNSIYNNSNNGISLTNGANNSIMIPTIESIAHLGSTYQITGAATPNAIVEIFKSQGNQGKTFVVSVDADVSGNWSVSLDLSSFEVSDVITATQTDGIGNTSEFSLTKEVYYYQPDLMVATLESRSDYAYEDVFESIPVTQIKSLSLITTETAVYYFKYKNAGNLSNSILITADAGNGSFNVLYYDATTEGTNITDQISGTGYLVALDSLASNEGRVEIRNLSNSFSTMEIIMTSVSTFDSTKIDAVKTTTTFTPLPNYQPDLMVATLESRSDYAYENVFESTPVTQIKSLSVMTNESITYYFKCKNAGNITNSFIVTADAASAGFNAVFYSATAEGTNITAFITQEGYLLTLEVSASTEGRLIVSYNGESLSTCEITLTAVSTFDSTKKDAIKSVSTFIPIPYINYFDITIPNSSISKEVFSAVITAKKANGENYTDILSTTTLSVDSGSIYPTAIAPSEFINGVWTGNISLDALGGRTILVSNDRTVSSAYITVYNATIEYTSEQLGISGMSIIIPAGSVSSEISISVTESQSLPGDLPFGYNLGGKILDISSSVVELLLPAVVTIPLNESLADPRVYYWNGEDWSKNGINVISYTNNSLTFSTTHFTVFVPVGAKSSNLFRIGPNPYNPRNGSARIWYWLTQDKTTSIYIMSLSGTLLWKQTFTAGTNGGRAGENNIEFNGKTAWNDILGDGVYLYKVIQYGKSIGGGKISVIK